MSIVGSGSVMPRASRYGWMPWAVLACLIAGAASAQGSGPTVDRFELLPERQGRSVLRVAVQVLPGVLDTYASPPEIVAGHASVADVSLGRSEARRYPGQGQVTAILFLLDISDPARQPVVSKNLEQIVAMARAGRSHHRFGLATFAEALDIVTPLGSDVAAIESAARDIAAVGQRTELIRLGAKAVGYVSGFEADRHAIVLMSDGEAEDDMSAYPPSHFANAATSAGVRVYALGYHPSREETFGKLRFIAEESGGALIRADRSYELPGPFLDDPFAWPDAGAELVFDMVHAADAEWEGVQRLAVTLELAGGGEALAETEILVPDGPEEGSGRGGSIGWPWWTWLVVAGGAAMLLLIAGGMAWLAFRRRGPGAEPIAYLEFLDAQGTRWPMRERSIKIGRSSDNDLQLKNDTVSAYHATIHVQRDGAFIVTDLNSLNGVVLDGEEIDTAELFDGAELELGEVRCRFLVAGAEARALLTDSGPDRTLLKEGG